MAEHSELVSIRSTHLGRGVFARTAFAAEQLVGEIPGQLILQPGYGSDYCVDLGGDARLEPEEPFRLLNHSCDPNCELLLWKRRQVQGRRFSRLWLQTRRPIACGEELTIDYAWPACSAIPCGCQSTNCRGWVVDVRELAQVLAAQGSTPRRTRSPRQARSLLGLIPVGDIQRASAVNIISSASSRSASASLGSLGIATK